MNHYHFEIFAFWVDFLPSAFPNFFCRSKNLALFLILQPKDTQFNKVIKLFISLSAKKKVN